MNQQTRGGQGKGHGKGWDNILHLVRDSVTVRQSAKPIKILNGTSDKMASGIMSGATDISGLTELDLEFDEKLRALWCFQRHSLRPNFTPELLADVRYVQKILKAGLADKSWDKLGNQPFNYLIWASNKQDIFNLGGDLSLFIDLIQAKDRGKIWNYAKSCIAVCYDNYINMNLPIITISLVRGDALGGGFESALSSDIIAAERSAQFGLPEILFGLFPGMGAYSFLSRRLGTIAAEKMIFSGRLYSGEELHEMGLVDILAEDGRGEETLYAYLKKNSKRFHTHKSLFDIRRQCHPVTLDELLKVADRWVDTALTLSALDIRKMRRLAKAQMGRVDQSDSQQSAVKGEKSQMRNGTNGHYRNGPQNTSPSEINLTK